MNGYLEDWGVDDWNADYYDMVEHYFWSPGSLGRQPQTDVSPLKVFRGLRRNEEPLNHMLMLFFRLAPSDLVQQLYECWFGERVAAEFEVQNRYQVDRIRLCVIRTCPPPLCGASRCLRTAATPPPARCSGGEGHRQAGARRFWRPATVALQRGDASPHLAAEAKVREALLRHLFRR